MTEKDKKEYARKRIERDLAGNPNDPRRKMVPKTNFPPPSKEDKERMKKLDGYGNPLPGYKWLGNKVVPENTIEVETERNFADGTAIHTFKTGGMLIHKNNLLPDKEGYLVNGKGETFKYLKNARNIPKGVYKLKLTTNASKTKRRTKKSKSNRKVR